MLNVAVVMGRLTADPELRHTPSDAAVTSFTLAVDRAYVKSGTERQTDFIDIVAWRGTAEFICRYFRKGQLMAVHGSIQMRTYTDTNGNKRKAFEIVADDVNFCGTRSDTFDRQPSAVPQEQAAAQDDDILDDDNPVFGNDEYEAISFSDADLPFGD